METRWLWPFELMEKIGEGGMGTVYRARYSGNNRQVAVKLLPVEVAADPVLLARFERELDVLKQLRHPNIVRCFGGTCESEQRFYAMELVEGGTLAELILRKPLAWESAVDYALQICEALQYAHEHGVIHRDIKPGNFLLTKTGQVKLSDFGLASIATANRLTASGRTVGTIQYMAPEQIRGKPALTNRADLYALGCVLYEMLTGQPPFPGDNAAAVMQSHLKAPPPHAAAMVLDCPLKLDQLICELLSKDPDQRPATADEVAWKLEDILQPGRRVAPVEPDLFSSRVSRTRAVSPLQNVAQTPSDADMSTYDDRKSSPWRAWFTVAVLSSLCIAFWVGWSSSAAQLRRTEQTLAEQMQSTEPRQRLLAAQLLAEFGTLQSATIESLQTATRDNDRFVRIAALAALTNHAAQCRTKQPELLHIEKVDEDPEVRHYAAMALEAVRSAPPGSMIGRVAFFGSIVLAFAGLTTVGWVAWQKFKPFAA